MKKLVPIEMKPGLLTSLTDRGAKNRWKDGNHVRWFRGLVEKIGGWTRSIGTQFLGISRSAIDWQSLARDHLIAFGTHLKLYVMSGGSFSDITPLRSSGTLGNNPFTMVDTSTAVSVHHTTHGVTAGDYVHYSGAAAAGGITINGQYVVTSVSGADDYVITHSAAATSSTTGGGAAVAFSYEISPGSADSAMGLGYGVGTYGSSTYGTARTSSTLINLCRIWSLDNWGEDLIACPRGGGLYVWDTSVGTGTRAAAISGAPASAKSIIVSHEDRHLIALGSHDGSVVDPLLIRWCDEEDYTTWTPGATNTSGRKRLDGGSEIYCGIKVGKEILVHTDTMFTSMVFEGPPYTFGFYPKGGNGNLMGPNAAKDFDQRCWWMGANDFFVYDGRTRVVPCDVRDRVFDDINLAQKSKVYSGANKAFGEVWWLYPSADSSECDSYVLYNTMENHWSLGTLSRSVLIADSSVFDPYGMGTDGYMYDHESGVDDNAAALSTSLSTWDMEIGEGERQMQISKVVPDFEVLVGSISASLTGKIYPHANESESESSGVITSTTRLLDTRIRARQISLTLATSNIGDTFKMGTLRIMVAPAGKR